MGSVVTWSLCTWTHIYMHEYTHTCAFTHRRYLKPIYMNTYIHVWIEQLLRSLSCQYPASEASWKLLQKRPCFCIYLRTDIIGHHPQLVPWAVFQNKNILLWLYCRDIFLPCWNRMWYQIGKVFSRSFAILVALLGNCYSINALLLHIHAYMYLPPLYPTAYIDDIDGIRFGSPQKA